MDEATKTNRLRGEAFKSTYFLGRVIDVGCGPDLIAPHAVPFDLGHGDAQHLSRYFPEATFDCVHSSHCLEHMVDVEGALREWWSLVKPGGHLVIVVPDEDLYEQGIWPPLFNLDHKATFTLASRPSWSPVSYNIRDLIAALPKAQIIEATLQDQNYNRRLMRRGITPLGRRVWHFGMYRDRLFRSLMRRGAPVYRLNALIDRGERLVGKPVDQTLGPAFAQIQVIARKLATTGQPPADATSAKSTASGVP